MSEPRPPLDPRALPELVDVGAWLTATEQRQREVLLAVVASLGPDFEVVYGDPDPRARPTQEPAAFAHASLQGGLRIEHAPSGLLLCFVPGGTTHIGLSDHELAVFDEPASIDGPRAPAVEDVRELHRQAPFMRGAQGQTAWRAVAPFLMAEAPISWERMARFGIVDAADVDPQHADDIGVATAKASVWLPPPLRLPSEVEWEHACRAGTRSPFPFGDVPPTLLADPLHPLGLAGLGHFPEATSDAWRRHLDAGVAAPAEPGKESTLGVVRGGAATRLPWGAGGRGAAGQNAGWLPLLSAWRATWFRAREGAALRPVLTLPCPAPAETVAPRRAPPTWRMARRTTELIGRLWLPDGDAREAARRELGRTTSGFGIWTGQAAAAVPWLCELATQESVPERHRLLVLIADMVAGDHAATAATGLDRTLPHIAETASHAPARALRQALSERLPKLVTLAADFDAPLRSAIALLATVLPEGEATARGPLTTALAKESVAATRASLVLALGRLDRFARRGAAGAAAAKVWFGDASALVAGAARLAALSCDGKALADESGALSAEHEAALMALVRCEVDADRFPWHHGRLGPLVARYLSDCLPEGGIAAGLLLARMVKDAGVGSDPRLSTWAEGAVVSALTGPLRRHIDELDARQWQVIADVSRRDFPELAVAWRMAGLPAELGARRTLIVRHRGRL